MAGRLAGQSNASLCRRVLHRTFLTCSSNGFQSELRALGNVSRDIGERILVADESRFSIGGNLDSSSTDRLLRSDGKLKASAQGFIHSQHCRPSSSEGVGNFRGTRSIGVRHLDDLQNQLGRRFQGFSTFEEVEATSKEAEGVGHPAPGDLHLPKLVNPTTELVNSVVRILERQGWGPEAMKELDEANVVVSPYQVKLIVQRISSDEHLAWNFFMWAREKATTRLSLRAYISLLECLARAKNLELTEQAIMLSVEDGHRNSAWPYNIVLKWFSDDVDTALRFWGLMKENKCRPTVITYTRLIDVLAKQGRIESASEIFRQMLQDGCPPNITTYNVLIRAFGAAGQPEAASKLFDKLSELGCKPNFYTYNTLIAMHVKAGNREMALKYFNMSKATGVDVVDDVYKALQLAGPDGKPSVEGPPAEELGDPATKESVAALSVSEGGFNHNGMIPGRLMNPSSLVKMMEKDENLSVEEKLDKIRPRIYPRFVVQVLQRLRSPETALIFFNWAKRQPHFEHNEYSYSMIISILGRSRNSESIDRLLKEMYEQGIKINTQIFTALITCYGRAKSIDGALQLFQQMKDWGCKPDTITYTSLIHLLAKHGSHQRATEMFKEMQQAGCAPNSHTYSVIIYNLLKSGKVTEAFELLQQMPELGCKPTPVTYATLIHHCAKDGQVDVAKEILAVMEKEGVKPLMASVTDLDVALRKAGRLEEAAALAKRLKRQRYWDDTYKVPTEKVARELVFKNFLASQTSTATDSVPS